MLHGPRPVRWAGFCQVGGPVPSTPVPKPVVPQWLWNPAPPSRVGAWAMSWYVLVPNTKTRDGFWLFLEPFAIANNGFVLKIVYPYTQWIPMVNNHYPYFLWLFHWENNPIFRHTQSEIQWLKHVETIGLRCGGLRIWASKHAARPFEGVGLIWNQETEQLYFEKTTVTDLRT